MSMTLILWKAPVVDDPEEAKALVDSWYERGDDSAFEPSDDIARAADMLRSRWPDDYEGGPPEGCPWADMPFEQSDRLLSIDIRWGADDVAVAAIYVIAKKLGLVLYDPQGPDVFLPADPLDSGPTPPPTVWDWIKVVAMAVVLCAVTYAASDPVVVAQMAGGDCRRILRHRGPDRRLRDDRRRGRLDRAG